MALRITYASLRNGGQVSQAALDFGRDHRLNESHRHVMRALNDAVDALGLMVAAGACGCRTQDLSDALSGRPNRYVRVEWAMAIMDIASPDMRHRIARSMVEWLGLTVTSVRKRTAEERVADLEELVARRFGQAGLELVEQERGR